MGRGWKIAIGIVGALVLVLTLNAIVTDRQAKPAGVNVPNGEIFALPGGDLQVVDEGPLARRARTGTETIVLIHCFTCAIDWWDRMRPLLERRHRVVAIDLLGHGGSGKPTSGYEMENQADLVAQALDRLRVRHATVVGHSLGGTVATALADRSPNLVDRLVIIDQAPNNDDYEREGLPFTARLTFTPVLGPMLWRVTPDFAVEDGLGAAFAPGYDVPAEFVEDFRRMTYTSYDASPAKENDYVADSPLDKRVRARAVPLLAIFGSEEQLYDPTKALAAYGAVPNAETALIDGAGHSPNVEKPARTAALVLAFAAR